MPQVKFIFVFKRLCPSYTSMRFRMTYLVADLPDFILADLLLLIGCLVLVPTPIPLCRFTFLGCCGLTQFIAEKWSICWFENTHSQAEYYCDLLVRSLMALVLIFCAILGVGDCLATFSRLVGFP